MYRLRSRDPSTYASVFSPSQVCTAETPPDLLFAGAESEEPLVDLEALQFETAAEGARLAAVTLSADNHCSVLSCHTVFL